MSKNSSYTKAQITLIMTLKKRGKTYQEVAEAFGAKFGVKKSANAMASVFHANKSLYDLDSPKSSAELKNEVVTDKLIESFVKMIEQRQYVPILSEFKAETNFTTYQIEKNFGSFDRFEASVRELHPEVFKNIIDESKFTQDKFKSLQESVSKYNKFFITTAVNGCPIHEEAYQAAKTFCKKNNAKLLVLICSDPAHNRDAKYDVTLDSRFTMDDIVFQDINLNSNLFISTIKLSAKHINPLTGLDNIAQNRGSFIFASPKQDIEHVTSKNKKGVPRAMITTGAITKSDYATTLYMSDRTAKIAHNHHKLGGIIVEVKNNKTFFYRNIQFDKKTGAFSDLDTKYLPDGKTEKITAKLVQFGDYHVLSTDPLAKKAGIDLVNRVKPDYLTLEDFFDGITINPHEKVKIALKAMRYLKNPKCDLAFELKACRDELDELSKTAAKEIILKYGNHEDFLKRWLMEASYKDDAQNHYEGICLAKALLEGKAPLEYAWKERYPVKNPDKIKFLGVNDSFTIDGVENGAHGHLGSNGKRNPNMKGLLKAYGKGNFGHNHSGGVYKDVFRAGTKTLLQLGYNDGPSAWTHSDTLQHRDGSRQLITYINGEYQI